MPPHFFFGSVRLDYATAERANVEKQNHTVSVRYCNSFLNDNLGVCFAGKCVARIVADFDLVRGMRFGNEHCTSERINGGYKSITNAIS
jgi:hypothetical protein